MTELPKKLRRQILDRDSNKCVVCWRKYQLVVHHFIDSNHIFPPKFPEHPGLSMVSYHNPQAHELVTLCQSCHGKIHTCDKQSPFFKAVEAYLLATF